MFLLGCQLLLLPYLSAQPFYIQYTLPDTIVPIDIISNNKDYIIIVGKNGLYELQSNGLEKVSTFNDFELSIGIHNKQSTDSTFYYPITQGGYLKFSSNGIEISQHKIRSKKSFPKGISEDNTKYIISTYKSSDSTFYYLTDNSINLINGRSQYKWKVPLMEDEELRGFAIDKNKMVFIISDQRIIIRSDLSNKIYSIDGSNFTSLYGIKENKYVSNQEEVYQLIDDEWKLRENLKPPLHIYDNSVDPFLVYENYSAKLSSANAKVLDQKYSFPNEIIKYSIGPYICTDHNFYNNRIRINDDEDHFYKIVSRGEKNYLLSKSGIYEVEKNLTKKLINTDISISQNHRIINGILYYHNTETISTFELVTQEERKIPVNWTEILDIYPTQENIAVLTSKSLVFVDRINLKRNRFSVNKIIPLCDSISSGQITFLDDNIWITCNKGILKINSVANNKNMLPSIELNGSFNDNTLLFKSNNYLTDQLNYTFHIRNGLETQTIWNKNSELEIEEMSGDIELTAKMRDDVFLQNVYTENISLQASRSKILNILIAILATILTTLLLLWLYRRWQYS